jgi:hypothetical protein
MLCVTRERAAEYLGIPSIEPNTYLDSLLASVCARLAEYTGRADWGPQVQRTQYDNGGHAMLLLPYWPIISVTEIAYDADGLWPAWSVIDATEYVADTNNLGIIWHRTGAFPEGKLAVRVQYVAGYTAPSACPEAVQQAAMMQMRLEYLKTSASNGVAASPGMTFGDAGANADIGEAVKTLLRTYRMWIPFR